MANGGRAHLQGWRVLLVAPVSACANALTRHLMALPGSVVHRIDSAPNLPKALLDGSWDVVVYEHYAGLRDAETVLRSVVENSDERPVVVIADEIGGANAP